MSKNTNFATSQEVVDFMNNRFTKLETSIEELRTMLAAIGAGGKRKAATGGKKSTSTKSAKKGAKGAKSGGDGPKKPNAMVWFKRQYAANNGGEYLTNYINTKTLKANFEKIKAEPDYIKKTAEKRLVHEADWVWKNLTKDQRDEVKAKHKKQNAEEEAKASKKKEKEEKEADSDAAEESEEGEEADEAEESEGEEEEDEDE